MHREQREQLVPLPLGLQLQARELLAAEGPHASLVAGQAGLTTRRREGRLAGQLAGGTLHCCRCCLPGEQAGLAGRPEASAERHCGRQRLQERAGRAAPAGRLYSREAKARLQLAGLVAPAAQRALPVQSQALRAGPAVAAASLSQAGYAARCPQQPATLPLVRVEQAGPVAQAAEQASCLLAVMTWRREQQQQVAAGLPVRGALLAVCREPPA